MGMQLNAAAIAAIDGGDLPLETTITVYDEDGAGIELPIGNVPGMDGQVIDAMLEASPEGGNSWHLTLAVQVDAWLKTVLLKNRKVVVKTIIRALDGTIAQEFPEFTGYLKENDALEDLSDDGIESGTYTLHAFGVLERAEAAYVNRLFTPANVAAPASGYWNLTPILRALTIYLQARSAYDTTDATCDVIPIPNQYSLVTNIIPYCQINGGTKTASSGTAADAWTGLVGSAASWQSGGEAAPWVMCDFVSAFLVDQVDIYAHDTYDFFDCLITCSDGTTQAVGTINAGSGKITVSVSPATSTSSIKLTATTAGAGSVVGLGDVVAYYQGDVVNPSRQRIAQSSAYKRGLAITETGGSGSSATTVWVGNTTGFAPGDKVSIGFSDAVYTVGTVGVGYFTISPAASWSSGDSVYNVYPPSASGNTPLNRLSWGTVSSRPWRQYEVDVYAVDRLVIAKGDAYTAGQTQGPFDITLAAGQEADDLPNLAKTTNRSNFTTSAGTVTYTVTVDSTAGFYTDQLLFAFWGTGYANRFLASVVSVLSATSMQVSITDDTGGRAFNSGSSWFQDRKFCDFYKAFDPQAMVGLYQRFQTASTIKAMATSRYQVRPNEGYIRWAGGPAFFDIYHWLITDAAPLDPAPAGNQVEAFLRTVLEADVGIPSADITLDATGVQLRGVTYKDTRGSDVLSGIKSTVLPPSYFVHDTRDGKVRGKTYAQLPDGDAGIITLRTQKSTSLRDQVKVATATRVRSTGRVVRNVAPVSALWVNPNVTRPDLLFDGDTQTAVDFGSTSGAKLIAVLKVTAPLEKLRIFYQGVLSVGIDTSASVVRQARATGAYQVSRFHPKLVRAPQYTNASGAWLEEDSWASYETSFPYYLWIYGEPVFDDVFANATPGTARAALKVWEVELWLPDRVDVWAYMVDNSATFPLPADAYPTAAGISTFADQGASTFGSPSNWWYSPSARAFYRYAPASWMKRNALSYSGGLHRINPLEFGGISASTAGTYATQSQNEVVRKTGPMDVRCVWEPVDPGDTVRLADGSLRTVMGVVKSPLGSDRSLTLATYDYSA